MNKKINAYMMAAMMAVVSPAIMGQTASDGVKVICNDVVQKGDSVYTFWRIRPFTKIEGSPSFCEADSKTGVSSK